MSSGPMVEMRTSVSGGKRRRGSAPEGVGRGVKGSERSAQWVAKGFRRKASARRAEAAAFTWL